MVSSLLDVFLPLTLGLFSYMHVLVSTLNIWVGLSVHLQCSRFIYLCPLWYYILQTRAALVSQDTWLQFKSGSLLGSAWVPFPLHHGLDTINGNKPWQLLGSPCIFPISQRLLSFPAWCLGSWKELCD